MQAFGLPCVAQSPGVGLASGSSFIQSAARQVNAPWIVLEAIAAQNCACAQPA
jgi:hypothetical protein